MTGLDQILQMAARKLGHPKRQEFIQTKAVMRRIDLRMSHFGSRLVFILHQRGSPIYRALSIIRWHKDPLLCRVASRASIQPRPPKVKLTVDHRMNANFDALGGQFRAWPPPFPSLRLTSFDLGHIGHPDSRVHRPLSASLVKAAGSGNTLMALIRRITSKTSWFLAAGVLVLAGCGSTPTDETAGWSTEKLTTEAKEEAAAGNYERASKLYERLEGRAVGTLLSQQAQLERAYLTNKAGEKAQSLAILERFIKLHNLGILGNLTGQNLAERDQQASRDSYQSFKQLVAQFPQSRYAPDAQLRMNYILNSLAAYEVHVARYYYKRGAFVAAASRAQQSVAEFQDSPSTEEALAIMARSYDKLGLTELRDDAQRVLKKNYPQSLYLTGEGLSGSAKAWWRLW
jgi:outer membrane protein assembly factor BamD